MEGRERERETCSPAMRKDQRNSIRQDGQRDGWFEDAQEIVKIEIERKREVRYLARCMKRERKREEKKKNGETRCYVHRQAVMVLLIARDTWKIFQSGHFTAWCLQLGRFALLGCNSLVVLIRIRPSMQRVNLTTPVGVIGAPICCSGRVRGWRCRGWCCWSGRCRGGIPGRESGIILIECRIRGRTWKTIHGLKRDLSATQKKKKKSSKRSSHHIAVWIGCTCGCHGSHRRTRITSSTVLPPAALDGTALDRLALELNDRRSGGLVRL